MSMFEAFFLALIQGLTEFLPISSSAHLILPSQIFGWADQGLAFDVAVHVGTLAAVIGYFRREVVSLLGAFFASFTGKHSRDSQLAWMIVLATIPACVAGLFLKDLIELYLRSAWVIAATTLLFGALLWWADRHARQQCDEYQTTRSRALFIGIAQALALIPGTSRSGATITAALMLGYTREAAARFSFLMSIPIITLAGSYLGLQLATSPVPVEFAPIGVGVLVSFVSAYACIHAFLKLVTRVGMLPFVIYRLILGVGLIALLMSQ